TRLRIVGENRRVHHKDTKSDSRRSQRRQKRVRQDEQDHFRPLLSRPSCYPVQTLLLSLHFAPLPEPDFVPLWLLSSLFIKYARNRTRQAPAVRRGLPAAMQLALRVTRPDRPGTCTRLPSGAFPRKCRYTSLH